MKRRSLLCLAAAAGTLPYAAARAQSSRSTDAPVTLVAPFAAGGQIDTAARRYAAKLSVLLQRPVLVENRPGASGLLAAQRVARSRPDGSSLLVTSSSFLIGPHVYGNAGYDAFKDFAVVSGLYLSSAVLVVGAASQAKTLSEFVALCRKAPRQYSYATNGTGTYSHLLMEKFKADAGIDLVHVPYKSAPEASQAVIGHVAEAAIDTPFSAAPRTREGQLRSLVVFGARREDSLPGVPTAAEAGYPEAGKLTILAGIVAPAKTPPDMLAALTQASARVAADPEYGAQLKSMGMEPVRESPAQVEQAMREQDVFYAGVIRRLGIVLTQ
jgi:tripartite-type tricarboxylate transporter receptor subunit TctC